MADTDLVRASDAERDAAAARLNVAVGEGRLTLEEFSDRVAAVYAARTRAELVPLLDDLPAPGLAVGFAVGFAVGYRPAPRAVARVPVGSVKRRGRWRLDGDSEMVVWCGSVKLDLRGAEITAAQVSLAVRTVLGTIKVWVPRALRVEVDGGTVVGTRTVVENHVPPHVAVPTLRLRLDTGVGTVKVYRV
jgi:hypothetical protein